MLQVDLVMPCKAIDYLDAVHGPETPNFHIPTDALLDRYRVTFALCSPAVLAKVKLYRKARQDNLQSMHGILKHTTPILTCNPSERR